MQKFSFEGGESSHLIEIVWTLVAVAGGIAKYLHEMTRSQKPFRPLELIAKVITSGFSGWCISHAAQLASSDPNFLLLCAAVGGWIGTEAMDWIVQVVKQRITGNGNPMS